MVNVWVERSWTSSNLGEGRGHSLPLLPPPPPPLGAAGAAGREFPPRNNLGKYEALTPASEWGPLPPPGDGVAARGQAALGTETAWPVSE